MEVQFKNDEEYFADTTHISNSMVSAYIKSPSYYKARYIDRLIDQKKTAPLIFGSAADCLLTEGEEVFNKTYSRKIEREGKLFKRSCRKKDDAATFLIETPLVESAKKFYDEETIDLKLQEGNFFKENILTPKVYDMVLHVTKRVKETMAFQWLIANEAQSQVVLTGEITTPDGPVKVKGKLDFLTIIGDTAYIDDYKTAQNVSRNKYHWHCMEFGYYRAAWFYTQLVLQNYPEIKFIHFRHLVVTKTDWPEVATFTLNQARIELQAPLIIRALTRINNQDFTDPTVSWDTCEYIGEVEE